MAMYNDQEEYITSQLAQMKKNHHLDEKKKDGSLKLKLRKTDDNNYEIKSPVNSELEEGEIDEGDLGHPVRSTSPRQSRPRKPSIKSPTSPRRSRNYSRRITRELTPYSRQSNYSRRSSRESRGSVRHRRRLNKNNAWNKLNDEIEVEKRRLAKKRNKKEDDEEMDTTDESRKRKHSNEDFEKTRKRRRYNEEEFELDKDEEREVMDAVERADEEKVERGFRSRGKETSVNSLSVENKRKLMTAVNQTLKKEWMEGVIKNEDEEKERKKFLIRSFLSSLMNGNNFGQKKKTDDEFQTPKNMVYLGKKYVKSKILEEEKCFDLGRGYCAFMTVNSSLKWGAGESLRIQYVNPMDPSKKFKASFPSDILEPLQKALTIIVNKNNHSD